MRQNSTKSCVYIQSQGNLWRRHIQLQRNRVERSSKANKTILRLDLLIIISIRFPYSNAYVYRSVRERVTDFNSFNHYSDKVVNILRQRASIGESIDVQDLFARFTLDAAGEFLFGTSELNTLDMDLPRPGKSRMGTRGSQPEGHYGGFVAAFEQLQTVAMIRFSRSLTWPLFEMFTDITAGPNKVLTEWMRPLINKALENKNKIASGKVDAHEGSFLDYLAQSTDDVTMIRDEVCPPTELCTNCQLEQSSLSIGNQYTCCSSRYGTVWSLLLCPRFNA